MGVKKIRTIFMRYMLSVACGIMIIFLINFGGYMVCEHLGVVISVSEIEREIAIATEILHTLDKIRPENIPYFCDYVFYLPDGTYQYGSLGQNVANDIWKTCIEYGENSNKKYRFDIINRDKEVLILRYRFTAQFRNAVLRRIIPVADLALIVILLVEIIVLLVIVSYSFGKFIDRKIDNLLAVTRRVEEQDLDFQIASCGIFEIDRALDALAHMKLALKKLLDEQCQADKMHQDQISALAHDLKTPLTIIRGNMELLYDTSLSDEQRECVCYVKSSVEQIQNYVLSLIDIAKVKQDFLAHKQSVAISEFLARLKVQAKGLCSVKNIQLKWNENYQIEQAAFDSGQLVRAIMNIISNAVEYTPEGGCISFTVYEDEKSLIIMVCDSGIGFSAEALRRATEQFYMDEHSRTSKSHYGMGLYITDLIVKQHGGELILENLSEAGGAKVTVVLHI